MIDISPVSSIICSLTQKAKMNITRLLRMSYTVNGKKTNFFLNFTAADDLMAVCVKKHWVSYSQLQIYHTHPDLCTERRKNVWIVDQILSFQTFEEALEAILEVKDDVNIRQIMKNYIHYNSATCDMYFGDEMYFPIPRPNYRTSAVIEGVLTMNNFLHNPRMREMLNSFPRYAFNDLKRRFKDEDYLETLIRDVEAQADGINKAGWILEYFVFPLELDCFFEWLLHADVYYASLFIEDLKKICVNDDEL